MATKDGYAPTYFGKLAKDGPNKGHYVTDVKVGSGKNAPSVLTLVDVVVWVPVTEEACAAAFAGFTFTPEEPDGTKHATSGVVAASGAKYMHALETPRGAIRTKAAKLLKGGKTVPEVQAIMRANEAAFRKAFEDFRVVGGGETMGGKAVQPLTNEEYEAAYKNGTLRELLVARGMMPA